MRNSFWHTHVALGLTARMLLGSVYNVPPETGQFDFGTLCAVLLHLRNPWGALEQVARRVDQRLIIVEPLPGECLAAAALALLEEANATGRGEALRQHFAALDPAAVAGPRSLLFRPDAAARAPQETWWSLPPALVAEWLAVLGFRVTARRLFVLEHDSAYSFHQPAGHVARRTFHPYYSLAAQIAGRNG